MGLDLTSALFLIGHKLRGVDFGRTLTLGHQGNYLSESEYQEVLSLLGKSHKKYMAFSDGFFEALGVQKLEFMDASDYEGATIIHDLNDPLPREFEQKWSCVIDGGTLEHVFNFPEAIKTCMACVEENGHLILITPWHHYAGHGFYQFSPELFYRILSLENGFSLEKMLIHQSGKWFSVDDPDNFGARVEDHGNEQTILYISAKRLRVVPIFSKWPQQSDYSKAWALGSAIQPNQTGHIKTFKRFLTERSFLLLSIQTRWRAFKVRIGQKQKRSTWRHPVPQDNGIPT